MAWYVQCMAIERIENKLKMECLYKELQFLGVSCVEIMTDIKSAYKFIVQSARAYDFLTYSTCQMKAHEYVYYLLTIREKKRKFGSVAHFYVKINKCNICKKCQVLLVLHLHNYILEKQKCRPTWSRE